MYTRHRILPTPKGLLMTPGVVDLAETHGAYWLMDTLLLVAPKAMAEAEGFCAAHLNVNDDNTAELLITDGGRAGEPQVIYREYIGFTDFPAPGVKIWLEYAYPDGTLGSQEPCALLPEEH